VLATRERFTALCRRIGAKDNPKTGRTINSTYDELARAYTGPDRHYHDINHISDGLGDLDRAVFLAEDADALEMAWWSHDFIYDPRSPYNEEESALRFTKFLLELGVRTAFRVKVVRRVMATKHDYIPESTDDQLMVDIDLVPLALPQEAFSKNTLKKREEYREAVPNDDDFKRGTIDFFTKFLDKRISIYLTEYFRSRYEAQAKENINRLISKLKLELALKSA